MNTTALAPSLPVLRTRPVWLVSALAGVVAAAATELYGLAARAVGVPMLAGNVGADTAEPVTVGMFATGTLTCTFWGTVLAVLIARYAARPARAYLRVTVALTAVSLIAPLAAGGGTAVSTRVMLALAHLLAAAIVVPAVTRRLAAVPGRR